MKDKLSRRDFLKMTLLGIGAGFIAACKQVIKPVANAVATLTATPSKTNTPLLIETNTPTSTPTPTEIPCFRLLSPENGSKLPAIGKITFSWEPMQGTLRYQIQLTFPNGQVVTFDTDSTNNTRYIESFLAGGIYTWQVTAIDENGQEICTAESFTFEKPAYVPPKNQGGNNNDSGTDSDGTGGGPTSGGGTGGGPTTGGGAGENGGG